MLISSTDLSKFNLPETFIYCKIRGKPLSI
jgi:hypothetical protein